MTPEISLLSINDELILHYQCQPFREAREASTVSGGFRLGPEGDTGSCARTNLKEGAHVRRKAPEKVVSWPSNFLL